MFNQSELKVEFFSQIFSNTFSEYRLFVYYVSHKLTFIIQKGDEFQAYLFHVGTKGHTKRSSITQLKSVVKKHNVVDIDGNGESSINYDRYIEQDKELNKKKAIIPGKRYGFKYEHFNSLMVYNKTSKHLQNKTRYLNSIYAKFIPNHCDI